MLTETIGRRQFAEDAAMVGRVSFKPLVKITHCESLGLRTRQAGVELSDSSSLFEVVEEVLLIDWRRSTAEKINLPSRRSPCEALAVVEGKVQAMYSSVVETKYVNMIAAPGLASRAAVFVCGHD
jgi:hypothetical protein